MATIADRPAARSSTLAFAAGVALSFLGLVCAVLILVRLLSTWHVSPSTGSHTITLLGQRLAYPAANADAVVVLAMALPALVAVLLLVRGAVREAHAAYRLSRALTHCRSVERGADLHGAFVLSTDQPLAFCAGWIRPRVYVSDGTIAQLAPDALLAVLEHERHHARRHDPLRLALGRVLSGALFFVPSLDMLTAQHAVLTELGADEAAAQRSPGSRPALARAILTFVDAPGGAGVDAKRVDHLLEPRLNRWRFPIVSCAAATALMTLVIGVALLVSRAAVGSTTLAPPVLSSEPCVLTLAGLTAALLLATGAAIRRRLRCSVQPDGG